MIQNDVDLQNRRLNLCRLSGAWAQPRDSVIQILSGINIIGTIEFISIA